MQSLFDALSTRLRSRDRLVEMDDRIVELCSPASLETVTAAEAQLGYPLPPFLVSIYTILANGGFGPGCGLIGLEGGAADFIGTDRYSAVDLRDNFLRSTRAPSWPRHYLPIINWGCNIYSCLDCSTPAAAVLAFDPNRYGRGPWKSDCEVHAESLENFLQRWLDGEKLWWSMPLTGEPKMGFLEYPELSTH